MISFSLRARLRAGVTILAAASWPYSRYPPAQRPAVAPEAAAAEAPPPPTVTADALPTWQINGVVWSQAIVGDTVYVTGSFTRARPPGVAAGGAGEVVANNIFAYRLSTGDRVTTFATRRTQRAGPGHPGLRRRQPPLGRRRLHDRQRRGPRPRRGPRTRPTARSSTGASTPNVGGQVRGLGITPTTVYVGGNFTSANGMRPHPPRGLRGQQRRDDRLGPGGRRRLRLGDDDVARPDPRHPRRLVHHAQLVSRPTAWGRSMASNGAVEPVAGQEQDPRRRCRRRHHVRQGRRDADLRHRLRFRRTEPPTSRARSRSTPRRARSTGPTTASVTPTTSRRPARCSTTRRTSTTARSSAGWPDTNPRVRWQKAAAQYSHATGTTDKGRRLRLGRPQGLVGVAYAKLLHWYPNFAFGSYTSAGPGRLGGRRLERRPVGRLRRRVPAGERRGPAGPRALPHPCRRRRTRRGRPTRRTRPRRPRRPRPSRSPRARRRVSFGSAWDMDDQELTYDVLRNNTTWVSSQKGKSNFWTLPRLGFTDKNLAPGATTGTRSGSPTPAATSCGARCPTTSRSVPGRRAPTRTRSAPTAPSTLAARRALGHHGPRLGRLRRPRHERRLHPRRRRRDHRRHRQGDQLRRRSTARGHHRRPIAGSRRVQRRGVGQDDHDQRRQDRRLRQRQDRQLAATTTATSTWSPPAAITFGVYNNGSYTATSAERAQRRPVAPGRRDAGPDRADALRRRQARRQQRRHLDRPALHGLLARRRRQPVERQRRTSPATSTTSRSTRRPSRSTTVQSHYTDSGRTLNLADAADRRLRQGGLGLEPGPVLAPGRDQRHGQGLRSERDQRHLPGWLHPGPDRRVRRRHQHGGRLQRQRRLRGLEPQYTNPQIYTARGVVQDHVRPGRQDHRLRLLADRRPSGSYDRHVYMHDDGQLDLRRLDRLTNTITTPSAVQRRPVAPRRGHPETTDGMKLYVDGELVGTNPQTEAQAYTGYWRVGGDNTWGCSSHTSPARSTRSRSTPRC